MRKTGICFVSLLMLLATEVLADEKSASSLEATKTQKMSLPRPEYLSELARSVLRQRMRSHGIDMLRLVEAVIFLQKDSVKEISGHIAREPQLVKPIPGEADDSLNAQIPPRFFALQDQLKHRAEELRVASEKPSIGAMSTAFSRLTTVCVSCHAVYLDPKSVQ